MLVAAAAVLGGEVAAATIEARVSTCRFVLLERIAVLPALAF